MLVKERFKDVNLFSLMNSKIELPTKEIISTETLNKLWIVNSGFKVMGDIYNLSDDDIAEILSSIYKDKWKSLVESFTAENNFDYVEDYKEKSTGNNIVDGTVNHTVINNVSAYDSDEPVTKDSNTQNNTSKNTNDSTGTKEYTKTIKNTDSFSIKQKSINFLQKNNLFKIIFADIDKVLCISVYDMEAL